MGPAGATGATGAQGPQGANGVQGDPGPLITWQGAWSGSQTYYQYQAVSSAGSSYLANTTIAAGTTPPAAPWQVIAQKGDQGIQGIQGIQGPAGTVSAAGPGTAALPSISFAADTNTGIWNPVADFIGFSTNGTYRWLMDSAGNLAAATDNTVAIGGQSNFRPSNVYIAAGLRAGGQAVAGYFVMDGPAGAAKVTTIATANSARWTIGQQGDAESGSNAGSTFDIRRFGDAGGFLGVALSIDRPTGSVTIPLLNPTTLAPTGNVVEQRNGTNAQTLRLYTTYTDASNYERATLGPSLGGHPGLVVEVAGTGGTRHLFLGVGSGAGQIQFIVGNTQRWWIGANEFRPNADNVYDIGQAGFRPRTIYVGTSVVTPLLDTPLLAPTANFIEQRNGANAQALFIYRTYTDASNYERLRFSHGGAAWAILTEQLGTGTPWPLGVGTAGAADLQFRTANANRWQISGTTFAFLASADLTYDIGAAATGRPRNIFVGGAVVTGVKAGAPVDADVNTPTDGMIRLDSTNNRIYARVGGTWRYAALT